MLISINKPSSQVEVTGKYFFISLSDMLYFNLQLKSVAHLPWRAFMYKVGRAHVEHLLLAFTKMASIALALLPSKLGRLLWVWISFAG